MTLIGDACHAVTPNMGQGACMAIEDAFVLATLLKTYWDEPDGHLEAFYQYERERKLHAAKIRQGSRKKMKLGQLSHPVACWIRNTALSLLPSSFLENGLREENVWEVQTWLDRAAELEKKRG